MNEKQPEGGVNSVQSQPPKIRGASLIIEEQPLMVLPSLAMMIGLEESIVVQKMYWLLRDERNGKEWNGHRWLFNTYDQWKDTFFPFWSTRNIRRIFTQLEKMHLVESCQPEGVRSRRKWYRLNVGMIQKLTPENAEAAKLATSSGPNQALPLTRESFNNGLKKSEETASTEAAVEIEVPVEWRPDERTKAEKLRTIRTPRNIPSEREFDNFISEQELDEIVNKRPDLYDRLSDHKWHHWNQKYRKWVPIRNWKEYVTALDRKIQEVF